MRRRRHGRLRCRLRGLLLLLLRDEPEQQSTRGVAEATPQAASRSRCARRSPAFGHTLHQLCLVERRPLGSVEATWIPAPTHPSAAGRNIPAPPSLRLPTIRIDEIDRIVQRVSVQPKIAWVEDTPGRPSGHVLVEDRIRAQPLALMRVVVTGAVVL